MKHLLAIALAAALVTVRVTPGASLGASPPAKPHGNLPASYAPADSADSLWRDARRAVADENWDRVVQSLQRLRARYPKSAYYGDSYYWEAYALYHRGGNSALNAAVVLLDRQRQVFASAETVAGRTPRLSKLGRLWSGATRTLKV